VAVMVESKSPFTVKPEMEAMEIKDYAMSWSRR
jgi:homogentisate 1,2-dioxygenase